MGTGSLIAVYVLSLYAVLAPVVLFGVFVLFDVLGRTYPEGGKASTRQTLREKDPAVWTARDIAAFLDRA